jgi:hypothetical protein
MPTSNFQQESSDVRRCKSNQRGLIVPLLATGVLPLLVTANDVPSSLIVLILVMKAICSSETWVLRGATRRHNPENGINNALVLVCLTNLK